MKTAVMNGKRASKMLVNNVRPIQGKSKKKKKRDTYYIPLYLAKVTT